MTKIGSLFFFALLMSFSANAVEIKTLANLQYTDQALGFNDGILLQDGNLLYTAFDKKGDTGHLIVVSPKGAIVHTQTFKNKLVYIAGQRQKGTIVLFTIDVQLIGWQSELLFLNPSFEVTGSLEVRGSVMNETFKEKDDTLFLGTNFDTEDGDLYFFNEKNEVVTTVKSGKPSAINGPVILLKNGNILFFSKAIIKTPTYTDLGYLNIATQEGQLISTTRLHSNVSTASVLGDKLLVQTWHGAAHLVSPEDGSLITMKAMDANRSACPLSKVSEGLYIQACYDSVVQLIDSNLNIVKSFDFGVDLINNKPIPINSSEWMIASANGELIFFNLEGEVLKRHPLGPTERHATQILRLTENSYAIAKSFFGQLNFEWTALEIK